MFTQSNSKSFLKDNFPLHYFAKTGNVEALSDQLFSNPAEAQKQMDRFDLKGRTVLQYACVSVNLSDGENCVQSILKFLNQWTSKDGKQLALVKRQHTFRVRRQQWKGNTSQDIVNFINHKDVDGETAISLAAKCENSKIVEILLLNSADVFCTNNFGEKTLQLIYTYTPSATKALLDKSISFQHCVDEETFMRTERSYYLDFTSIIGYPEEDKQGRNLLIPETLCLQLANDNNTTSRKVILTHPLVRQFLEMKMKKIRWINFTSLLIFLCWILTYAWHVVDIYYKCCELDDVHDDLPKIDPSVNVKVYCSDYPFQHISSLNTENITRQWTAAMGEIVFKRVTMCFDQNDTVCRFIPLMLLSCLILITSIFQGIILNKAYLKLRNLCLWMFLMGLLFTSIPTQGLFKYQYQAAAFTILLALVVMLELVNRHIYWTIYIRVLLKLFQRFLAIVPLFFVIMIVFATSLRMLFPSVTPPVEHFHYAMMRLFEAIVNGKLDWTNGGKYRDAVNAHFRVSGLIMFLIFYVMMVLLFFRVLIGFVVADTKKIQEEEELDYISKDSEDIYLIECLLFSNFFQSVSWIKKVSLKFMLFSEGDLELCLPESKIGKELRPKMRAVASKNPVKTEETVEMRRKTHRRTKVLPNLDV